MDDADVGKDLRPIRRVFFELLEQNRATLDDTVALSVLRHDRDLLPQLQRRCEQILKSLERHQTVVYDIQGFNDAGVDVVVVLDDGASNPSFIGFQVKSDVEADDHINQKLKTQWFDARSRYGERLVDYYILLAWNLKVEKRRRQLRSVAQTFATLDRTHIVEPQFAATFLLKLTTTQIAALAGAFLSEDDPLLVQARQMSAEWSARVLALYVEALARHLLGQAPMTAESLRSSQWVTDVYRSTQPFLYSKGISLPAGLLPPIGLGREEGDLWEYLAEDLETLEDFLALNDRDEYCLPNDDIVSLALGYDLLARHAPSPLELRMGLAELLNPIANLSSEELTASLIDTLWYSDLGEDEQVEALGLLLQANAPSAAARAVDFDLDEFDPESATSWYELADCIYEEVVADRRYDDVDAGRD
ncbi:MAG TPA: hypothetical protein VEA78_02170 [Acidimicrobiales bacterium]|nr:hypothetical protein [Acidimicrobiales bacterium]